MHHRVLAIRILAFNTGGLACFRSTEPRSFVIVHAVQHHIFFHSKLFDIDNILIILIPHFITMFSLLLVATL